VVRDPVGSALRRALWASARRAQPGRPFRQWSADVASEAEAAWYRATKCLAHGPELPGGAYAGCGLWRWHAGRHGFE
jgi:hypothetical protein